MNFRHVRYFVSIADHGNFHRAAEALHVAQSALSRHMQVLGQSLGGPLFERVPGGVRTTPLGQIFYVEARALLDRTEQALERTRKAATGEIGRLVVGINELGARNLALTACIARCRQRYPEIDLVFERLYSSEQIEALQAGKLDLALLGERPIDMDRLEHLALYSDAYVIALPDDHPLAAKAMLEPADLAPLPFVVVRLVGYAQWQALQFAACRRAGFIPRIVQAAVNEQMQLSLIRNGLGIGFVNASVADTSATGLALRPVCGINLSFDLDLAWMRDNRTPARDLVVGLFREMFPPQAA